MGDIVIACENLPGAFGGSFQKYVTTNISVSLGAVNVTNNIDFGSGADITDAVLTVHSNNSTSPSVTSSPAGPDARFAGPQFGALAAANRVEWNNVIFPVPGAPNDGTGAEAAGECDHFEQGPGGCFPTTTYIRISSLRANASQLGVPAEPFTSSVPITAFVSITGEIIPPISGNVLSVGESYLGLVSVVSEASDALQCDDTEETVRISLAEGFSSAFKTEGSATFYPGPSREAGYYAPGSNGSDGASQGTRFLMRFLNIPQGVKIQAPKHVAQQGGELDLAMVANANTDGIGGNMVSGEGLVEVDLENGTGYVVYEVSAANQAATEALHVDLKISWDGASPPPAGVGGVMVSLAPLSTALSASKHKPEPRFIDSGEFQSMFTISACEPPPPPPPSPAVLTKLAGDNQTVLGGSPMQPLSVAVTRDGQPLAGHNLSVLVVSGAPTVSCQNAVTTNAGGVASIPCFTKSTTVDINALVNVTDGTSQLVQPFSMAVQAPDIQLSLLSPSTLRLPVNETTPNAIRAKVASEIGPASGVPVYFTATSGITIGAVAGTNESGIASPAVTLGCLSGHGRIDIGLAQGQAEYSVKVEPIPADFQTLSAEQGNGQSARPGERLSRALVIEASDSCGNSVPDLKVSWAVQPAHAANLEGSHAATNNNGRASTLVRVGSYTGAFKVIASARGKSVTFSLEAEPGPSGISTISGHQQRVPKRETAAQPLVARVTSPDGQPFAGVRVNFRIVEGSGQLDPSSVLTDDNGSAAALFTAGSRLGPVRIEASAVEETTEFQLIVTGRRPKFDRNAVVDGAGFGMGLTPGGCGSVFGINLMEDIDGIMVPTPNAAAISVDGKPLAQNYWPVEYEGVSVHINGVPAPLFALANVDGSEQINFQVPFDLGTATEANIEIDNNGTTTMVDNIPILPIKPRIFEIPIDEKVYAAALHLDYMLVEPDNPARPGEIILLYLTGLGPTDPAVSTNLPGPVPPAATVYQPTVRLNGADQQVLGSYYAPQLTSVYQVNLVVGEETAPGEHEIEVLVEGTGGQRLLLPVGAQ